MAKRNHLFPSRTQKLSSLAPKVVAGTLAARIGRCDACTYKNEKEFWRGVRVRLKEHGWKPCKRGDAFRGFESLPLHHGRLAQLGEHLPYKQGVTGSIPVSSID